MPDDSKPSPAATTPQLAATQASKSEASKPQPSKTSSLKTEEPLKRSGDAPADPEAVNKRHASNSTRPT